MTRDSDDMSQAKQIVPGISITDSGKATVDPSLTGVLFDLAIGLEEMTDLPVDVEHVVAAILLAVKAGEHAPRQSLSSDDKELLSVLAGHVRTLFNDYGGILGTDD